MQLLFLISHNFQNRTYLEQSANYQPAHLKTEQLNTTPSFTRSQLQRENLLSSFHATNPSLSPSLSSPFQENEISLIVGQIPTRHLALHSCVLLGNKSFCSARFSGKPTHPIATGWWPNSATGPSSWLSDRCCSKFRGGRSSALGPGTQRGIATGEREDKNERRRQQASDFGVFPFCKGHAFISWPVRDSRRCRCGSHLSWEARDVVAVVAVGCLWSRQQVAARRMGGGIAVPRSFDVYSVQTRSQEGARKGDWPPSTESCLPPQYYKKNDSIFSYFHKSFFCFLSARPRLLWCQFL